MSFYKVLAMNIKKLQKEVLDIIEDLRGLGAEINVEEFETLASSEDEEALNILRNVVKGMRDDHASRSRKQSRAAKREEEEDIEPAQPDDEEDAEGVDDQDAEDDDDSEVQEDGDRKIDDETDEEDDDEEAAPKVAMPLSVKTKLATTVKIATNEDVEEYYALLLKLKLKIEALESIKDDNEDDKLLMKLLAQTYKAYDAAMEHLEDLADDTFPTKLERFGNEAKKALIAELSEQGEDGKKKYHFDTKNASFSRFVRIADASVAYSYVLTLRKVKDSSGYVFPEYVLIVTQKMHLSEEDQERGLPAKPRFHVTRLLRDNPNYELGNEFKTTAELITRIKKMLAYDNLRTDIEKINIPFTRKELSRSSFPSTFAV